MDLALKTEYWDDPKALGAFKDFMLKIHGLDFSEWEAGGYWDDAYTPFSFFKEDTVDADPLTHHRDQRPCTRNEPASFL